VAVPYTLAELTEVLERAGFVAAGEEAAELLQAAGLAGGGNDSRGARLEEMVARRLTGEPLAWITGNVRFCGLDLRVHRGVYVPRWQSEQIARRAAARLPDHGVAVDLCTGCGAVAAVLRAAHPRARVVGTDVDGRAVACARENGVEAYEGDLLDPLPADLRRPGVVDLVVGVVPYVPTPDLDLLPRDTLTFESTTSYDGGPSGTAVLRRAVAAAPTVLRPGSALVLELGGDEADALADDLEANAFRDIAVLRDEDGDMRGIEATCTGSSTDERDWRP
jgi:release factor glutamine methyltransferase